MLGGTNLIVSEVVDVLFSAVEQEVGTPRAYVEVCQHQLAFTARNMSIHFSQSNTMIPHSRAMLAYLNFPSCHATLLLVETCTMHAMYRRSINIAMLTELL